MPRRPTLLARARSPEVRRPGATHGDGVRAAVGIRSISPVTGHLTPPLRANDDHDHERRPRPAKPTKTSSGRSCRPARPDPGPACPRAEIAGPRRRGLGGLVLGLRADILVWFYRTWDREPDYTHGFLVVPIALVILWHLWPKPEADAEPSDPPLVARLAAGRGRPGDPAVVPRAGQALDGSRRRCSRCWSGWR